MLQKYIFILLIYSYLQFITTIIDKIQHNKTPKFRKYIKTEFIFRVQQTCHNS